MHLEQRLEVGDPVEQDQEVRRQLRRILEGRRVPVLSDRAREVGAGAVAHASLVELEEDRELGADDRVRGVELLLCDEPEWAMSRYEGFATCGAPARGRRDAAAPGGEEASRSRSPRR